MRIAKVIKWLHTWFNPNRWKISKIRVHIVVWNVNQFVVCGWWSVTFVFNYFIALGRICETPNTHGRFTCVVSEFSSVWSELMQFNCACISCSIWTTIQRRCRFFVFVGGEITKHVLKCFLCTQCNVTWFLFVSLPLHAINVCHTCVCFLHFLSATTSSSHCYLPQTHQSSIH